jgi:hypothetical protein
MYQIKCLIIHQNYKSLFWQIKTGFLAHLTQRVQAVSEEKIFLTLANQKQELSLAAIFVGGMGRNEETL